MFRRVLTSRLFILVATATVTASIVGGAAYAAIPSGNTITGCYRTSGGALRVIDADITGCRSGETQLQWDQQGSVGPIGPAGPAGAAAVKVHAIAGEIQLPSAAPSPTITSLPLPAGSYYLTAVIDIMPSPSESGTVNWSVFCRLAVGGHGDNSLHRAIGGNVGDRDQMVLSLTPAPTADGSADLSCNDAEDEPAVITAIHITAIQVQTIN